MLWGLLLGLLLSCGTGGPRCSHTRACAKREMIMIESQRDFQMKAIRQTAALALALEDSMKSERGSLDRSVLPFSPDTTDTGRVGDTTDPRGDTLPDQLQLFKADPPSARSSASSVCAM